MIFIWTNFSFGEAAPIQVALNNMVLSSTSVKEYNVDMASAIIAGIPTLIFMYWQVNILLED